MSVVVDSPDVEGRAALTYGATEESRRQEKLIVVNATKGDTYVDTHFAAHDEVDALAHDLERLDVECEIRHDVVPDIAEAVLRPATRRVRRWWWSASGPARRSESSCWAAWRSESSSMLRALCCRSSRTVQT